MTKNTCPCQGCKDRWVTSESRCHSTCTLYKDWKDRINKDQIDRAVFKQSEERVSSVLYGRRKKK